MAKKQPLSRFEQLAGWSYPALASKDTQQEMARVAKSYGKKGPQAIKLLSDKERGYVSPLGGVAVRKG